MTTYTVAGCRKRLRTSATRRYLIVCVFDGRPKVEASTDDENAAARLLAEYRRTFGPGATLSIIDQSGQGG